MEKIKGCIHKSGEETLKKGRCEDNIKTDFRETGCENMKRS
jgi:hypothetical protein